MSRERNLILRALININVSLTYCVARRICLKKKRSQWRKNWLRRRNEGRGALNLLNCELRYEDPNSFKNFLRLDNEQFEHLLSMVEMKIKKQDTFMRESISTKHRLNITLRFLATGETFRSLMYSMRVHESTISKIVPEVCTAILESLGEKYLKTPTTSEEWLKVALEYEKTWNFPHCLGAIDGRHITFRPPISSGSYYYNYKGTHSIVLLGLVDANYRFLYANVGVNGRVSDGGVFDASNLCKKLRNNTLNIPSPSIIEGTNEEFPYVFIADDAFPLLENLMKPFPQRDLTHENRIYNYRLSRARRMVESAFGILANRWRVLLNPINLSAEKVQKITLACITLHNFLVTEKSNNVETNAENDSFDLNLPQIIAQSGNRSNARARLVRENFKDYFNSPIGAVDWQNTQIERGNR